MIAFVEFGTGFEFGLVIHGYEGNFDAAEVEVAGFSTVGQLIPIVCFAEANEAFFGEGVREDGAFECFLVARFIFTTRFGVGDFDIEDGGAFKDIVIEEVIDVAIAAVSHTASEFDEEGMIDVEFGMIEIFGTNDLIKFGAAEVEEGVAAFLVVELDVSEGMSARIETAVAEAFPEVVFLEFFPQPNEVVFKGQFADMEHFLTFFERCIPDEVDEFGFAAARATVNDDVVKRVAHDVLP